MKKWTRKIWIGTIIVLLGTIALGGGSVEAAGKTTKKKAVYTIKTYKASYKGKKLTAKYQYDLPRLKGSSKAVKKINASLKKGDGSRLISGYNPKAKTNLIAIVKANDKNMRYKEEWHDITKCKASYNKKGYISFKYSCQYYIGGVVNDYTYGRTYDLRTGKELTVADVIAGDEKQVKQKIVRALLKRVDNSAMRKEALKYITLKDINFYLKDGKVVVCFGPYLPGGGLGKAEIVLDGNYE